MAKLTYASPTLAQYHFWQTPLSIYRLAQQAKIKHLKKNSLPDSIISGAHLAEIIMIGTLTLNTLIKIFSPDET